LSVFSNYPPALVVLNATNGPASLVVSDTLTATNGVWGSWAQLAITNRMTNLLSVADAYNGAIGGTNWATGSTYMVPSSWGAAFAMTTNSITNLVAGAYHVQLTVSCLALADTPPSSDETHFAVFTNDVEMVPCEIIMDPSDTSWVSGAAQLIVTLPANVNIDVRHKNVDDTDRVIIRKLCLTVTPAN
jgi:hypothetical protein